MSRIFCAAFVLGTVLAVAPGAFAKPATDLQCDKCVGGREIENGAVGSNKIRNESVKPRDLAPSAKPAGLAAAQNRDAVNLTPAAAVIVSVILRAPADGKVSVIASWTYSSDSDEDDVVQCSISMDEAIDTEHATLATTNSTYFPGGTSRSFTVEKGNNPFNLVCASEGNEVSNVFNSNIGAIFTPTKN